MCVDKGASALMDWSPEHIAQARRWVENWKETGPELERIRRREIRATDTPTALSALSSAFAAALFLNPKPRPSSGLVEQQRLFSRWRKNSNG